MMQEVSGIRELVGTEVNRLFRLTKNRVTLETGWNAYILCTAASLRQLGPPSDGLREFAESHEHLGEVTTYVTDLHARYEEIAATRHVVLKPEEIHGITHHDFAASPAVVWEWLNDPYKRTRWFRWTTWTPGLRPAGRTGIGAVNHCAHSVGNLIETILEWRPYRYFTVEMSQDSIWSAFEATYQLDPLPDGQGTRLEFRAILRKAPAIGLARPVFKAGYSRKLKQDFVCMAALMAES